jgi:putative ABC transport system substrate-binding protein
MGGGMGVVRRSVLALFGATAVSGLRGEPATQPIRVGVLLSGSQPQWAPFEQALIDGLRDRGFVEGRNLTLVRRYGELQLGRIRGAAGELAGMQLDAIVTSCTGTTRAVVGTAAPTPVVIASLPDPVISGLAESLSRPGGRVTGRSSMSLELLPKRLELLRLVLPERERSGARVAVLLNGKDPAHEVQWQVLQTAAGVLDAALVRVEVNGPAAIESALEALPATQPRGLIVMNDDPVMIENRARIAQRALQLGLPSISGHRVYAEAGGLMSYGMDLRDDYRLVAAHVVKVAEGADPATLPIERPTRFQLTLNLRTAASIGVTLPAELRLRADETLA